MEQTFLPFACLLHQPILLDKNVQQGRQECLPTNHSSVIWIALREFAKPTDGGPWAFMRACSFDGMSIAAS